MNEIRLEFNYLKILRKRSRWKIYFIVVAEHPDDNDKMLVKTVPDAGEKQFTLRNDEDNVIWFKPKGGGADGLFILERKMPSDKSLKVRIYIKHSRKNAREVGNVMGDIENKMGDKAMGTVSNILGSASPWLVIAKSAFSILGGILGNIKDKDLGTLVMDEGFRQEIKDNVTELDRVNSSTSGDAEIGWCYKLF